MPDPTLNSVRDVCPDIDSAGFRVQGLVYRVSSVVTSRTMHPDYDLKL